MTGNQDNPEAQREAADGAPQVNHYTEPGTNPMVGNPAAGGHPAPSYVDPSAPQPQPLYADPTTSGPQQYPQFYADPASSGPQPATSGAYPVQPGSPQAPNGQLPADGGGSPGHPQAGDAQSAPYPQAGFAQQPVPGQVYPQPGQTPSAQPGQFAPELSSAQLLRQAKPIPQSGWRKFVYLLSGKTINLGESPADRHRRELIARINQPLQGCYKIAMLSLKGGVGKTTTTATLGATFASLRGDRVIAVDANPDRGTLSQKIPLETTATVRHLLRDAARIRKYSDIRTYTSQGPSRLEVLASEQDPAVSEAFSEDDYRRTVTLLEHFYNVVLTDCGTGLMHSAMKGVLDIADSLVIISSSSIDGARSASATLDWLDAHGYGDLVARSVTVINSVRPSAKKVDIDKLTAHFASRCRAVAKIPFDPHLEEGAEVELDQLASRTRLALLELAAIVADDFPHAAGRQQLS